MASIAERIATFSPTVAIEVIDELSHTFHARRASTRKSDRPGAGDLIADNILHTIRGRLVDVLNQNSSDSLSMSMLACAQSLAASPARRLVAPDPLLLYMKSLNAWLAARRPTHELVRELMVELDRRLAAGRLISHDGHVVEDLANDIYISLDQWETSELISICGQIQYEVEALLAADRPPTARALPETVRRQTPRSADARVAKCRDLLNDLSKNMSAAEANGQRHDTRRLIEDLDAQISDLCRNETTSAASHVLREHLEPFQEEFSVLMQKEFRDLHTAHLDHMTRINSVLSGMFRALEKVAASLADAEHDRGLPRRSSKASMSQHATSTGHHKPERPAHMPTKKPSVFAPSTAGIDGRGNRFEIGTLLQRLQRTPALSAGLALAAIILIFAPIKFMGQQTVAATNSLAYPAHVREFENAVDGAASPRGQNSARDDNDWSDLRGSSR